MTAVTVARVRGGNRLPEGHPARGRPPAYERVRAFGPDAERRDRNQRERARRAAHMAGDRGELDRHQHRALTCLLDVGDRFCSPVWPALATIGRYCGGYDERTAGRWMAELRELGWVERIHRYRFRDGQIEGDTNLWRVVIPERYRETLQGREDAARARSMKKNRPTPKAPQNRREAGRGGGVAPSPPSPPRRWVGESDCPTCEGRNLVEVGDGTFSFCPACSPKAGRPPP